MISQLANHLWHSTVFAGVVALLTLMLRRNRAALRHSLWMTASVKFLIPFSLLIGIGREVGWRNVPVIEQPRLEIVEQISEPFALQASTPVTPSAPEPANPFPAILLGIWLCGFTTHSMAWWRRWRRVRIALRTASPASLNLPTAAMFGPAHLEPGVFGILKPVLLLPRGITERLTPTQFDAIVAHELCHVRRRDNLAAAIHMVVEALFWFHPLVWWIERRLVEERERACDEEVLQMAINPQDYAEGIVNICRLYLEAPLVCMSRVTGANLKQRVEAIMANRSASKLNLGRKLLLATAGIVAVAGPLTLGILTASRIHAQATTATPTPKFEVASVKPCENNAPVPGLRSGGIGVSPNRLHVRCVSVGFLIQAAYVTFGSYGYAEVSGGPAWIHSEQFDIEAETEGNPSARTLQGPMLQALLEDRFKLRIRREVREVPVYNLTVSKGGFKLQPMKPGNCVDFDFLSADTNARADLKATIASLEKSCGRGGFDKTSSPPKAEFHGMTLDKVATFLSRPASGLGRPVINKTGITGVFDFEFEFSPEEAAGPAGDAPAEPSGAPSIFSAMEKSAGLKLDRAKGPGTFFVIEAAERPSEIAGPVKSGILTASQIHVPERPATNATPAPKFEVASVKANKTAIREGCRATNSGGQTYTSTNCPLGGTIQFAYDVTQEQLSALTTNVLLAEKYDITAKSDHPASLSETKQMLQSLLEDRFKLSLRRETKEMPVYALVVGKGGPKFRPSHAEADEGPKSVVGNAGQLLAQNVSVTNIVMLLSRRITDRTVVDKTGLKGTYDLDMAWSLELGKPDGPSIFTAIKELGLKLEPRKIPVEILVIDHIERPSGN